MILKIIIIGFVISEIFLYIIVLGANKNKSKEEIEKEDELQSKWVSNLKKKK